MIASGVCFGRREALYASVATMEKPLRCLCVHFFWAPNSYDCHDVFFAD